MVESMAVVEGKLNEEEWTYRKRTLISFDFALFFLIIVNRPTHVSLSHVDVWEAYPY